jgi:hypothetical protein
VWAFFHVNASDERVKKDIEDLSPSDLRGMLNQLEQIRTIRYRFKDESAEPDPQRGERLRVKPRIGVTAQSMPEELRVDEDGEVMGVDMGQSIGFALATIKALKHEVDELKKQVEQLKRGR